MSYMNAEDVLPSDLLETVQKYIEGELLYIPKRHPTENTWGSKSGAREYYNKRNALIFADYEGGTHIRTLSEKYHLSEKSIHHIIRALRQPEQTTSGRERS